MHHFKTSSGWHRMALALLLAAGAPGPARAADVALNDAPLFSATGAPGNVALALSVEFPTALSPAHFNSPAYTTVKSYLGYFDPAKCYRYQYNPTTPSYSYFVPAALAANRRCSTSAAVPLWSGNYLNWSSMGTIDTFRMVLTGGFRAIDKPTLTVLERSLNYAANSDNSYAPSKELTSDVTGATPFNRLRLSSFTWNQGTSMVVAAEPAPVTVDYIDQSDAAGTIAAATAYRIYMRAQVCDTGIGLESNCVRYGSGAKPEGLMQEYADKLNFSVLSYLNTAWHNDGGVLRTRMKPIGPTFTQPGNAPQPNPNAEWDASTGMMPLDPDASDGAATVSNFNLSPGKVANSGAMNYLNKFGRLGLSYKTYDPVGELYYAALRYFKGAGNVDNYSQPTSDSTVDGFPVIKTWDDPIRYSCQKNFILGIGDVNAWGDANIEDSQIKTKLETQTTPPGRVTSRGVTAATNMVGQLEGMGALGTRYHQADKGGTYFIAGLAYDAHTVDLRSDLAGDQLVDTYWLDVVEAQKYQPKAIYWLAAKYGGFKVPPDFKPYAAGNSPATLAINDWHTNSDVIGGDPRPDNFFVADQADNMKASLVNAFQKIAATTGAANSTAFATASPNISSTGTLSYATRYDPQSWTGELSAARVTFDREGRPTSTALWNARDLLQSSSVTAETRKIVTCCTAGGAALPFTSTALGGSLHARTYTASFAHVGGVDAAAQSSANFVAYLRGDKAQELGSGGVYRARRYRLGDIVNGKPVAVDKPQSPYYDDYNPGYSGFKARLAKRRSVVYAGANDGMLHAFDATAGTPESGSELFAYIPSFVYGDAASAASRGLAALGNPNYLHRYYVDATPGVFDVDLARSGGATTASGDWRTLLIGGLGKGGRGYYAIDVTDPSSWTSESAVASRVLWEFTDPRMGYSYGTPSVVKTNKYGWVVILTSGYNNSDGRGYFFFVNPSTGALLEAVATPQDASGGPLNLAHHTAYVASYADMTADAVYAGDLTGNVWRLDLTPASGNYEAPLLVARLENAGRTGQPVTTRPLVEVDPASGRRYLLLGTGRLLADEDIASTSVQSLYAIADGEAWPGGFYTSSTLPSGSHPITRSALVANTDLTRGVGKSATALGWYHDLPLGDGIAERVNVDATANQGVFAFVGTLPGGRVCEPGGRGRLYALGFGDGKSVLYNPDGSLLASTSPVSNLLTDIAIQRVHGKLRLYAGGSGGEIVKAPAQLRGAGSLRQLNWREVPMLD